MSGPVPVPERAGREGDQPLPREGEGDVIRELQARLEARREIGMRRYGRALQQFNGRDPFRDYEDELFDAYVYAGQIRLEYQALAEAVRVLARYVREGVDPAEGDAVLAAVRLGQKLEELHRGG